MTLLLVSIPLMVVAIGVAVIPLIATMLREERTRKAAFAVAKVAPVAGAEAAPVDRHRPSRPLADSLAA